MLKSILKTSVYIACFAWSGFASAAGLGAINVTSSLGQPLKAEIEVVSVDKADKQTLRAKLASADTYKSSGVDYPFNIPKIKFQIEDRADGEPFIRVTTAQPINDPFVTLLVELSWSSGKLLREYTFLLDPVDYQPQQAKTEELKPIEPILAEPSVEPVAAPLPASEPVAATPLEQAPAAPEAAGVTPLAANSAAPVAEPAPAVNAPAQQALPQANAPAEAAPIEAMPLTQQDALSKEEAIAETAPVASSGHIVVAHGDTLRKIAAQVKPANVSLERMLVALYRENAGVFDGHNMNRIKEGKILNMPQNEAVQMLPQADAEEAIRVQAADWNVYRQKLSAVPPAPAPATHFEKQEISGKISAAVIDKAFPAKEPAKEVLKLSKGEAPTDKAVAGGKTSAQEKDIAKEEEAIAKSKALKEAQERTAILEKNVQDMKRLAELKKEPASAPVAAVTMNAASASAPHAASSVAEAKPKPKIAAPKVVEEPSLIDQVLEDPVYLAGAAAVLLLLGGMGFMVARRGKGSGKKKPLPAKDIGEATGTGRIAAPVAPSPETGDFTHAATQPVAATSTDSEEVDPIGEADLFLTFGRDAQAEEVLKEALKKNPNNLPVKLKLLSIYASRKDTNSFYIYAREIKESGDGPAWEQTATMGRALDPTNPFYGGSSSAAPVAENKTDSTKPAVDFDVSFGSPSSAKADFGSQSTIVMERPSNQEKTTILSSEELRAAAQATPMDFDITGTNPGSPAMILNGNTENTAVLNTDDLVFDVTATLPKVPATKPPAAVPGGEMAFSLDFPTESKANKPAVSAPDLGLDEISLNLDKVGSSTSTSGTPSKDEHWQEVATKLDLAKAYQEMGDTAGAREILDEVLKDGDAQQRESAQALMQQLL